MKTILITALLCAAAPAFAADGWVLHENNGPASSRPPVTYSSQRECEYAKAKMRTYRPPNWSATCQQQAQ
jgi:hypothetical protein